MSKKNKRAQQAAPVMIDEHIDPIPHIIGGEFNYEANRREKYAATIASASKRSEKLRVLWVNEASFLHTGFSTYGSEVMKRLHATGKYALAELASYGGPAAHEERARSLPWKYYHTMPGNDVENAEYRSDARNQFGMGKLSYALADFKPDVVVEIRDWWMGENILKNPLRGKFHFAWMPTVDGYPQRWEWLKDYNQVDTLLAYSYFGKRVLEEQSVIRLARAKGVKPIKVFDVCQPGVDLSVFKPLPRDEVRQKTGVPKEIRFCGTVMRNQPRKLFPRIIESFCQFKKRYPADAKNVYLLLHTSIPDVGWDEGRGIIETIERCNIEKWVMFSYICHACGHMTIKHFMGVPAICPRCNKRDHNGRGTLHMPNVQFGFPPEFFNLIYNLMDVYIQGSIAEGDGMPINEAKAAGVPVIVSDYSAMYEKARNGGGLPIENETLFSEGSDGCPRCAEVRPGETHRRGGGTMQWRSLFDRKSLAKRLSELFGNEVYRRRLSQQARECAERYYDWDLTALKWQAFLDTVQVKDRNKTWNLSDVKIATREDAPLGLSDDEWLLWAYRNILRRTKENGSPVDKVDADGRRTWIGFLQKGVSRKDIETNLRKLMAGNEEVAELLKNPERAGMNPMEKVAAEVREAEANE